MTAVQLVFLFAMVAIVLVLGVAGAVTKPLWPPWADRSWRQPC